MSHDPPGLPILDIADGRATVTLNRPAHHNRLHPEDLESLLDVFASLAADPALKLLVITATGPTFCSGFHLGAFDETADSASDSALLFERTVDALEALPVPTLCRFNGSVYGGATDLALACDFRVGVDTMRLRMPAARLGLHYYPSGLRRYVSRLGLRAAKRLFLLAEEVGAAELAAIGYLDRVVPAVELDRAVAAFADALAAGAPLAVRGMKTSLDEIARGEYDLQRFSERQACCAASEDLREGRAAFAERRAPRFGGR